MNNRILIGIAALALIIVGGLAFDVYAGGWNVVDGMAKPFKYNDIIYNNVVGLHNYQVDPDGDFDWDDAEHNSYEEVKYPDIIVETSYLYYVKITDNGYLWMDEAQRYDTYTVPVGNQTYVYEHYTMALDVTIKTSAESMRFSATQMDFEQADVDISMRFNVALNPWVAKGQWDENFTVIGGWAGIMSMSILQRETGVTQEPTADQPENVGHTIQGGLDENAAVNMWSAAGPESQRSFDDTLALVGVPSSVDGELTITLGAGAWTHQGPFGWDSVLVYNAYVTYTVRVDVMTCLLLQPIELGGQKPLAKPVDNNTGYVPEIPILSDLMKWWNETWAGFFNDPVAMFFTMFVLVVIVVIVYFFAKMFLRRPSIHIGG